jgi:dipeptidyl aminopeptidase/acylaminoacyl peptidase
MLSRIDTMPLTAMVMFMSAALASWPYTHSKLQGEETVSDEQKTVRAASSTAVASGVALGNAVEGWSAELTLGVKRVGAVQVSPDGSSVAYTVRETVMDEQRSHYLTQIHSARIDGSDTRQLTRGDQSCDDPQWSPDGRWLAFVSDRPLGPAAPSVARGGTNERSGNKKNVWVLPAVGGEAFPITDARGGVSSFKWSPDGRALAFVALDPPTPDDERAARAKDDARVLDENVKLHRLHVAAFTGGVGALAEPRLLTADALCVNLEGGKPGRAAFDWSPDGKAIVFSHVRTPSPDHWPTADLSRVTLADGQIMPLMTSAAAETSPACSPDGQWIAVVVSAPAPTWAGDARVHLLSATGGQSRALAKTPDGFGRYSEVVGWSHDSRQVYVAETRGTDLALMALPIDGGDPTTLFHQPGMGLSGVFLNPSRSHFGWSWETVDEPNEAWVASVASTLRPQRVSRVHVDLPRPATGRTEPLRWRSTEGFEIEGLVTYPVGYQSGRRYPLLLVIHGGPMGVFTRSYIGSAGTYPVAVFASRGYVVLRPNPRGSSGYGRDFRHANAGDWGGGDYRDIMAGVDRLIELGVADADRLGVMGWSYGGYMTSWTITQTKRFRCASVGAGVTNLMSFTGTADIPGFLPDYFGGEFWDKPEVYAERSAMFQIKGVTTPTLIQHGERDERVPLSQGLELYNALKRQNCPTRMVIYPRTPHGIEEPRLLLDAMRANLEWFDRYLKP